MNVMAYIRRFMLVSLVTGTFLVHAANEGAAFDLIVGNKCDQEIRVELIAPSAANAGEEVIEGQTIRPGATARMTIDPNKFYGPIKISKNAGEIRIHVANLLQDRQNSNAASVMITDANFLADKAQPIDINWQR